MRFESVNNPNKKKPLTKESFTDDVREGLKESILPRVEDRMFQKIALARISEEMGDGPKTYMDGIQDGIEIVFECIKYASDQVYEEIDSKFDTEGGQNGNT